MHAASQIYTCARCQTEFNGLDGYSPPGWIYRSGRLYCAACAGCCADPIDDVRPAPVEPEPALPEALLMTATGRIIKLTNPDPATITIVDIATALSRICRFAAHTERFYSVAEHSVRVSHLVPPEAALAALLHDASEAYLGDVTSPLKEQLPTYRQIERRFERAIDTAFALDAHRHRVEIKAADIKMCVVEAHRLMPQNKAYWGTAPDDLTIAIDGWSPAEARRRFLERFSQLNAQRIEQRIDQLKAQRIQQQEAA